MQTSSLASLFAKKNLSGFHKFSFGWADHVRVIHVSPRAGNWKTKKFSEKSWNGNNNMEICHQSLNFTHATLNLTTFVCFC